MCCFLSCIYKYFPNTVLEWNVLNVLNDLCSFGIQFFFVPFSVNISIYIQYSIHYIGDVVKNWSLGTEHSIHMLFAAHA